MPAPPEGWRIMVDVSVTRRKRYHQVWGPDGRWRFSSRLFWDCVEFLAAEGIEAYLVHPADPSPPYVVPPRLVTERKH